MDFADVVWLFQSNSKSRGIVRLNIAEGALLWRYARLAKIGILEIGRRHGGSTCLLAGANPYVKITSVDREQAVTDRCRDFLEQRNVELLVCDSRSVPLAQSYDLAFIDGDHSYKGVKADYENLEHSLTDQAIVIFHDAVAGTYGACDGVTRFVSEAIERRLLVNLETADSMLVARKTGPSKLKNPNHSQD